MSVVILSIHLRQGCAEVLAHISEVENSVEKAKRDPELGSPPRAPDTSGNAQTSPLIPVQIILAG